MTFLSNIFSATINFYFCINILNCVWSNSCHFYNSVRSLVKFLRVGVNLCEFYTVLTSYINTLTHRDRIPSFAIGHSSMIQCNIDACERKFCIIIMEKNNREKSLL